MRRVVITGVGPLTPVGIGKQKTWKAICEGKSGIDYITKFDAAGYRSRIAGEVRGFKPEEFLEHKEIKRTDLFVQYAVAATKMALDDATFFCRQWQCRENRGYHWNWPWGADDVGKKP